MDETDQKRRKFIKLGMAGIGAVAIGTLAATNIGALDLVARSEDPVLEKNRVQSVPDDPTKHWGFLIDLSKCDGCEALAAPEDDPTGEKPRCTYACRSAHYLMGANPPQYWIRVYKFQENPLIEPYFFPKPCQNCQDAPCRHVCPTGATFQREDGTILINQEICIGCRICMAACPYETRFFWFDNPPPLPKDYTGTYSPEFPVPHTRGTVSKCDLCLHAAYHNSEPHCVKACPQGALYYGDINEDAMSNGKEIIPLEETIAMYGGYRYKEEEGTNPSNYYLPKHVNTTSKLAPDVNVSTAKHGSNRTMDIVVTTKSGSPLADSPVFIQRTSTFGRQTLAQGRTNSKGVFSWDIPKTHSGEVIIEVVETKRFVATRVSHHV